MPIQKFRSVEEMNAAPIRVVAAANAFERFARHCGRFRLIYPCTYPRGVFRFRSLAEAHAARERLALDNVGLADHSILPNVD